MKPLTVAAPYSPDAFFWETINALARSDLVEEVLIVAQEPVEIATPGCRLLAVPPIQSQTGLDRLMAETCSSRLLLLPWPACVTFEPGGLEGLVDVAQNRNAGLVYCNFYEEGVNGKTLHPLNDYQAGSVRDDFDFGAVMLFSVPAMREASERFGLVADTRFAGLYDLRLKLFLTHEIYHVREPLYTVTGSNHKGDSTLFAYVDPRNFSLQKEMEIVFTDYLKRIAAYLSPEQLRDAEPSEESFPVEATVVIPVRNRQNTIAAAVKSALSQETTFPFNIIVVDNHSTDGTTAVLRDLAATHPSLVHVVPEETGLAIGGCWNHALQHKACGRYAVQLDSDDLYSSTHTLQTIVDTLRHGPFAMVIGSYTIVNERLEEIPPGLIDHREWTLENGYNNALRINGLGAPRAFDTAIMRKIRFLNVSYGEDYSVALRICREYKIGRIYESLYLCRRWSGNTDAVLTIEAANQNDLFKDSVRTAEILTRQQMNLERMVAGE